MDWRNCSEKRDVLLEVQKCISGRKILYLYLIYININISRQHFTEHNRVQIIQKQRKLPYQHASIWEKDKSFLGKPYWNREGKDTEQIPVNRRIGSPQTPCHCLSNPWADNIQI